MLRGNLITVFQYLKGSYKGQKLSLHKEPREEDKGQWAQVTPVPIAGGFEDAIGQGAR